jgi:hypothetical protein
VSLQTWAPLAELHRDLKNLSLHSLENMLGSVDLAPPYQRQAVWGVRRRQRLVMSLLRGLSVGSITVNKRGTQFKEPGYEPYAPGNPMYAVIDGKQRWETVVMFLRDEFPAPRTWWPEESLSAVYEENEDGPYVRFSMLSKRGQNRFAARSIPFDEVTVPTIEAEREVFRLLNTGGLPQGEEDDDR